MSAWPDVILSLMTVTFIMNDLGSVKIPGFSPPFTIPEASKIT